MSAPNQHRAPRVRRYQRHLSSHICASRSERPQSRLTVVSLGPLAIGLTIYELSERVEVRLVKGEWVPVATSQPERWRSRYDRDWTTHKDRPTGRFVVRA